MPLPRSLARFNRVALNHVMRHITPHMPGFGVVHHVGRNSGNAYSTPVNVFARPGGYTIALTYGTESEWTGNVLAAGEAEITMHGRDHHVTNPRLVHAPEPTPVPRAVGSVPSVLDVDTFLLVDEESGT
jgi:deazaflavin-dependent oxidoreductase (nitroreductase family)